MGACQTNALHLAQPDLDPSSQLSSMGWIKFGAFL
jgi:hypothetical protein